MIDICEKYKCTGCGACFNVCHKGAIQMQEDELGFKYPLIDKKLCVECYSCHSVCPNNKVLKYENPIMAFIAKAADVEEQKSSVSGGLASAFSRYIVRVNGIVYGCTGKEGKHVKHIRVEKESELLDLKGSKYVQSDIDSIFQEIKKDLIGGKRVLFIGTPCQVAGLLSFLRKTYDNLYTMDFVCHGVPSQQLLNSSIKSYNVVNECYSVSFRKKMKNGRSRYGLFVYNDIKSIVSRYFPNDNYIVGFLQGLYYRESCYTCNYARKERVSDITVGDYWDKENICSHLMNKRYGLSMLIINTVKGYSLFEKCQSDLDYMNGNMTDFINRNSLLSKPMMKHKNHNVFKEEYISLGFKDAAFNSLKNDINVIKRSLLINSVVATLYKIPFMRRIVKFVKK